MFKWNKKNLPNTRLKMQQFIEDCGLHPYGVESYKGRDILLAETDLETDRPVEYPWGYYQTSWFMTTENTEKMAGGSYIEFEAMHDREKSWTPQTKRRARLGAVVAMAKDWIDKMESVNA